MTEPIGVETHERLRRLPWAGPEGKAEYVTPGTGVINQIADSTEAHIISMSRDDAAYGLTMAELPDASPDELRQVVRKLAATVNDVAHVAELRGERLSEPVTGPAGKALEEALRAAFKRWTHE